MGYAVGAEDRRSQIAGSGRTLLLGIVVVAAKLGTTCNLLDTAETAQAGASASELVETLQ